MSGTVNSTASMRKPKANAVPPVLKPESTIAPEPIKVEVEVEVPVQQEAPSLAIEEDKVNVISACTLEPADETPQVHSLTVTHKNGHTDIVARVHTPTGWANKRIVMPGYLTASRIGCLLSNVASW